jgi:hypothetical protein
LLVFASYSNRQNLEQWVGHNPIKQLFYGFGGDDSAVEAVNDCVGKISVECAKIHDNGVGT